MTFNDFIVHMAPIIVVELAVFTLILPWLFRGSFTVDPARVTDVMELDERGAIRDARLLVKCGVVLLAVFAAFVTHSVHHVEPSVVALLGAGVLALVSGVRPQQFMPSVEWETLLFFAGLFVLVDALVETGVIGNLARAATDATGGDALLAVMLILVVSAPLSRDHRQHPLRGHDEPTGAGVVPRHREPRTRRGTLVVVGTRSGPGRQPDRGRRQRERDRARYRKSAGTPISFWEFTRKGAVVTVITIALAAPYLWLRYFVLV